MHPQNPILVVDDNLVCLESTKKILSSSNFTNVETCSESLKAINFLEKNTVEAALFDLSMPEMSGLELLKKVREDYPKIPVIIITGVTSIGTAVESIKAGAYDFVTKPINRDTLVSSLNQALAKREKERKLYGTGDQTGKLKNPETFSQLITRSSKMIKIFHTINAIAQTERPVLITGETGVGKELISKVIHKLSNRTGAFFPVNAAGLDDNLFSDALFGHVKGAFTGADSNKKGAIELSESGTIFLDEIGDLTLPSQIKLLRFLQEKEYLPLGAEVNKKANVRVIAATNKDLWEGQKKGRFRADLNYRLRTHHIHIPPLRERLEDLPLLIDHFIEKSANELKKRQPHVPRELVHLLSTYPFPGNIRELEAIIFNAVTHHHSKILSLKPFKTYIQPRKEAASPISQPSLTFHETLPSLQIASQLLIEEALNRSNNNQSIAANILGISQSALSRRLKNTRYSIQGSPA